MRCVLVLLFVLHGTLAAAAALTARAGWVVAPTSKSFAELLDDTKAAIKANGMGVVTQAGPTSAAARRGVTIPGNRVIGAFNNVYAVRILRLSTAAMIEAPIRFYLTENEDGTATLSYKTPSTVFAPYFEEADVDLQRAAEELDDVFAAITKDAIS